VGEDIVARERGTRPGESVRTLKHGEETAHFNILNLSFDPWGNEEEWRRRYILHPDFDVSENVVIVEENGKWSGGGTAWFREALLKNHKKVLVYGAGDLYVHPDHRGKGVYSTAMRSLNKLAQKKDAALGFAYPAIYRVPSLALPKYGFAAVLYPMTHVFVLNPEKFFQFLISRAKKAYFPEKFNGMKFKLTVLFNTPHDKREVTGVFRIEKGELYEIDESQEKEHVDLTVRAEAGTFVQITSAFYLKRRALLFSVFSVLFQRHLRVRFSLRFLRAFLGL
jgi:GNAT superfamily N-acetyltransferase